MHEKVLYMLSILLFSLLPIVSSSLQYDVNTPTGPLSHHFQTWLSTNGYEADNFVHSEYGTQGSFGGKQNDNDPVNRTPVIFIHGNTDTALYHEDVYNTSGWNGSIRYFLDMGYSSSELYATSWGDNNPLNANTRAHTCQILQPLRRFVEAVLKYTGAKNVSLVSHSMGVTLARKVVKGGPVKGDDCDLGTPLTKKVDVFLGISGGNFGLCSCQGYMATMYNTCNSINGFWPGDVCGMNSLVCAMDPLPFQCDGPLYSNYLMHINQDPTREGQNVYSMWSKDDELIGGQDSAWGRPTSLVPRSNGHKIFSGLTHMQTKELTGKWQYNVVRDNNINESTTY